MKYCVYPVITLFELSIDEISIYFISLSESKYLDALSTLEITNSPIFLVLNLLFLLKTSPNISTNRDFISSSKDNNLFCFNTIVLLIKFNSLEIEIIFSSLGMDISYFAISFGLMFG